MSPVRSIFRLFRLGVTLARGVVRIVVARQDPVEGVHETAAGIMRLMNVDLRVTGVPPARGLVICNHLGYLDVVVLAATVPCVFVAKREVRHWPAFGWFARRSGCIFAERESPTSAGRTVRAVQEALDRGHRVVLFPEGTSSGGAGVLPFRSSLLEPAAGQPLTIAAVGYRLDPGEGDPGEEVCYWKDMKFFPHMVRLLGKRRIHASLSFAAFSEPHLDRKALALELHSRVEELRAPRLQRMGSFQ